MLVLDMIYVDWIVKKGKKIYRYFEMSFSCFGPFGVWGMTSFLYMKRILGGESLYGSRTKLVFYEGQNPLKRSIKSPQKWLFSGSRWPSITFETNLLEAEILMTYVTLEAKILTPTLLLKQIFYLYEGLTTLEKFKNK